MKRRSRFFFEQQEFDSSLGLGDLSMDSPKVICSLVGEPEKISITPSSATDVDGTVYRSEPESVSITWYYTRSSVCWLLVAAAALAVARLCSSIIDDDALFFTDHLELSPERFLELIRVANPTSDLRADAEKWYSQLPKSKEVTAWLSDRFG